MKKLLIRIGRRVGVSTSDADLVNALSGAGYNA